MRRFELFAECLLLGVLVTVAALPLVTLPAALAAGCCGVRRMVEHRAVGVRPFVDDLRGALRGSGPAAAGVLGGGALLGFDAVVVGTGLPGGTLVAAVVAAVGVGGLVVLLRAAALWRAGGPPWTELLRSAASRAAADLSGCLLLVGALGALAVLVWVLPVLLAPALGCLVLAATAVQARSVARR